MDKHASVDLITLLCGLCTKHICHCYANTSYFSLFLTLLAYFADKINVIISLCKNHQELSTSTCWQREITVA